MLDFFKAQAVHPDALPDAVFRCIGANGPELSQATSRYSSERALQGAACAHLIFSVGFVELHLKYPSAEALTTVKGPEWQLARQLLLQLLLTQSFRLGMHVLAS